MSASGSQSNKKNYLFISFRFLAEFTSRASSLITFPLLAKYLGTEGYGVNTQTNTIITFLVPIASLGLGFGVVRLIAGQQNRRDVSSRFYSSLAAVSLVSIFLSLIVFLLAPLINSTLIKVDWATRIVQWSAPLIFLSTLETAIKDYYRARLRIIAYSVFQIIQTIAYVTGVALVLTNGGGLLQVVWFWLVIKIVFNLSTYVYFLAVGEIELKPTFIPREEMLYLLRFGFPIVVAGLGTWITNVGDRWVIGYFMTIDDVAVYNAAYTLAGIITALASPFWNPLYPLMSTYFNNNDFQALFHATRKYTNGFSLLCIPAVAGIILLANPLLVYFGSPDFSIHPITIALIILGIFSDQFTASMHYQIYLHNDTGFVRNVLILSGVANILFNLIMVPLMGITGAALATFLSYILLDIFLFRRVMSYGVRIRDVYDFPTLARYAASALIMSILILIAFPNVDSKLPVLIMITLIGALTYGFALASMYRFDIKKMINSI